MKTTQQNNKHPLVAAVESHELHDQISDFYMKKMILLRENKDHASIEEEINSIEEEMNSLVQKLKEELVSSGIASMKELEFLGIYETPRYWKNLKK